MSFSTVNFMGVPSVITSIKNANGETQSLMITAVSMPPAPVNGNKTSISPPATPSGYTGKVFARPDSAAPTSKIISATPSILAYGDWASNNVDTVYDSGWTFNADVWVNVPLYGDIFDMASKPNPFTGVWSIFDGFGYCLTPTGFATPKIFVGPTGASRADITKIKITSNTGEALSVNIRSSSLGTHTFTATSGVAYTLSSVFPGHTFADVADIYIAQAAPFARSTTQLLIEMVGSTYES